MRVVFSEALRNQRVAELVSEIGPGRGLRLLAQYLERQMEAGRLRRMDPQIAARSFVGPLIVYVATQELFRATHGKAIPADEMARNAAAIFLRGMAVEPNEGPPRDS
jgi:AcrR family transcriptional regulator